MFISLINSRATLQTKKVRRFSDNFYSTISLYIYTRTFIHYHLLFIYYCQFDKETKMGSRTLILIMFLGALCVAQALRCNHCQQIDKDNPTCEEIEDKECSSGFDQCIKINMLHPAYGEVRRCANTIECNAQVPPQVQKTCCNTDLCN